MEPPHHIQQGTRHHGRLQIPTHPMGGMCTDSCIPQGSHSHTHLARQDPIRSLLWTKTRLIPLASRVVKVQFHSVLHPKFANAERNHWFSSAVFLNLGLEREV